MTAQEQKVKGIKETVPLNLTGFLPQKFTPQPRGSEQMNIRNRG